MPGTVLRKKIKSSLRSESRPECDCYHATCRRRPYEDLRLLRARVQSTHSWKVQQSATVIEQLAGDDHPSQDLYDDLAVSDQDLDLLRENPGPDLSKQPPAMPALSPWIRRAPPEASLGAPRDGDLLRFRPPAVTTTYVAAPVPLLTLCVRLLGDLLTIPPPTCTPLCIVIPLSVCSGGPSAIPQQGPPAQDLTLETPEEQMATRSKPAFYGTVLFLYVRN